METLKRWKLECPLLKREAYLTFSIIETTSLDASKREGIVGLLKKCSLCTEAGIAVCNNCRTAANLNNLSVSLE